VTSFWKGSQTFVTKCDKGVGVNFTPKSYDVIYGRPPTENPLPDTRELFQYFETLSELLLTETNVGCVC
jgi:hypothetical protein